MTTGLIFSAGKETRFDDARPKALSMIGDVCLLDYNIACLSKYCDEVYVVCSRQNKDWFEHYETITVKSGYGCGNAVLQALSQIPSNYSDHVFIAWGDCVLCDEVLKETKSKFEHCRHLVIPCAFEHDPYVRLVKNDNSIKVEFKKYGEVKGDGFHDFGVFFGHLRYIRYYLNEFHKKIFDTNTYEYTHKHNNEMQFLDVVNETNIEVALLSFEDISIKSFNTKEELKNIRL